MLLNHIILAMLWVLYGVLHSALASMGLKRRLKEVLGDRFKYYPRDVWLYLMASGWNRIGQEEHLMGRAGLAGDEIGSALIGSRLVRDLMRLCFLMEQQYAPYLMSGHFV